MREQQKGVSSAVFVIVVIVVLLVAGFAGYYAGGAGSGSGSTKTVTSTQTVGAGQTVTVTSTVAASGASGNLVQLAKSEGTLTIYGVTDANVFTNLTKAFKQLYPWANINYLSLDSSTIFSKVSAEHNSSNIVADVVIVNAADLAPLISQRVIRPYCNPVENYTTYSVPTDPKCLTHYSDISLSMLGYNTNQVKDPSQLPSSWMDLAKPQYKGQFCVDRPGRLSTAAEYLAEVQVQYKMSYSQWLTYLNGIKSNQPLVTSGSGGCFDDVLSGQVNFGIVQANDVSEGLSKGAPISYKWITPLDVDPTTIGLIAGSPHQRMAELWLQWESSWLGQVAWGQTAHTPPFYPAAQVTSLAALPIPFPGNSTNTFNGPNLLLTNLTGYGTLFTSLYG